MLANSRWSSLRQFDCSCFRYTPAGVSGRLFIDLSSDLKGVENFCEGEGVDIYVDLPFSPLEGRSGDAEVDNEDEGQAVSMETSAVEPQRGLSPSCSADSSQGKMSVNVLASIKDLQSTYVGIEDSKALFGYGVGYRGKGSVLGEKLHKGFLGLVSDLEQSSVEAKEDHGPGSSLSQVVNQASQKPPQKADRKHHGKRVCTLLEGEVSKQRKVRPTSTNILNVKDESKSPAKVLKKSVSSPIQWNRKSTKGSGVETRTKEGKDALLGMKSAEPNVLFRAQPTSPDEDISREEATLEYQQCVSLLEKYGVLNSHEFYLSQSFPGCVPHPGYVGDGLQSKWCKTCRALEDANNTVICDECQEAFHTSCCLPRLSYKHFDREDDWYCSSCRKQKRRTGSFNSFRLTENGFVDSSGKVYSAGTNYSSKVRLGPAHQVDVPSWTGKVEDGPTHCFIGHPGMEVPLSQEEKDGERDHILKAFKHKVQSLNWLPAKMLPPSGTSENWLKCQNVFVKAFRDHDGRKHSEVICGKWRRAPLNFRQSDHWECFCVMEWDPFHADCAVPQELPTEEILQRMQAKSDIQPREVLNRQGT